MFAQLKLLASGKWLQTGRNMYRGDEISKRQEDTGDGHRWRGIMHFSYSAKNINTFFVQISLLNSVELFFL